MAEPTGLAEEQLRTLDRLTRIPALASFYLAGGGAIALHLGHRRSLDLDLFSRGADVDLDLVRTALLAAAPDIEVVAASDATLRVRLGTEPIDIVRYPYPPLEEPQPGPAGVLVAGLRDLAVMKLAAIARRGIRRDFWDLRVMLAAGSTLRAVAGDYLRRFGVAESDLYHVARALTYFVDAEKDPAFPAGMTPTGWEEIKSFFVREAPSLLAP